MDNIIKVKVKPTKCLFSSENFKIYSFNVIENIEGEVKLNRYRNFTIKGDYQSLMIDDEYTAEVIYEGEDKYGHQYVAYSIYKDKPTNQQEALDFFKGIINERKLIALSKAYPDFIDRILKDEPMDLSNIKGIKEKTFNKIKEAVIDNIGLMEFHSKFSKFGLTATQMKRIQRQYKTVDNFQEKLNIDIYKTLLDVDGIGFIIADKIALSINPSLKKSVARMTGCVRYYLEEVKQKGNTWVYDKKLYKDCIEHTPECIDKFGYALENDMFYYDKANDRVAFKSVYDEEMEICQNLLKLLKMSKDSRIDIDLEDICNGFEFDLTSEQRQAIENVFKYKVSILGGNAGSGKTFSTQVLIKALEKQGLSYILLAPTGKASQQMSIYTEREASTIHRGLGYRPELGFEYNENNTLPYDVVVIDENSMTDIMLFKSVLRAIDYDKTRLLLIQDFAQIPSVSCGNIAYDLVESNIIPVTRLTKIFRYDKGGLIKIATDTREGRKFVDNKDTSTFTVFGDEKDFMVINKDGQESIDRLKQGYRTLINRGVKPIDILVLTSMNKGAFGTVELSKLLQEIANPEDSFKKEVTLRGTIFREGDLLMQVKNNYRGKAYNGDFYSDDIDDDEEETEDVEIFNGNFGILKEIIEFADKKYFIIEFNGQEVIYNEADMSNVLLGYSITTFKAQGSSAKYVFAMLPASHKYMLNRNLMYVAFTRAKVKCYAIGTHSTINATLKKSAQLSRDTFLKYMLMEEGRELM